MTGSTSIRTATGVQDLLYPSSVAVFGASSDLTKYGGRVLNYLIRHGFQGRIIAVNPARKQVQGVDSYARIMDAGIPIDLALVAVPREKVVDTVQACADAGVKVCVILTAGFAEESALGVVYQNQLVDIAREGSMRVMGPNCMGVISPHHQMALTSSLVLEIDSVRKGGVALVSQSGALMVSMFNKAHDAGIGFSACVSIGNQVDLDPCDLLEYFADDPHTTAICLYVEGLQDPLRFAAAARRCRAAGKPVLMVKVGRTDVGQRITRSHTASMAGSYAAVEALCREAGVLLTNDPDSMIKAAAFGQRWDPREGGIGVVSSSGGGAAVACDRLVESGLRTAELSEETKVALADILTPAQAQNPVDLGGRLTSDPLLSGPALETLAHDCDVAVVLVVLTTAPQYDTTTESLTKAALKVNKPVIFFVTPGTAADGPRQILRRYGQLYVDHMDDACRILQLSRSPNADYQRERPGNLNLFGDSILQRIAKLPDGQLTELEVKCLLTDCGIPVNDGALAATPGQAVKVARRIGYPVVLKGVSRDVVHKSDVGAVHLNLADDTSVKDAFNQIIASISKHAPTASVEGCLVQEMVVGPLEVIVGLEYEPGIGPLVLVGAGGLYTELLDDVQMATAPLSAAHALRMLNRLRIAPIFKGLRQQPALDIQALSLLVARMSSLGCALGNRLIELEANPVIVQQAGEGVIAVDARATLTSVDVVVKRSVSEGIEASTSGQL